MCVSRVVPRKGEMGREKKIYQVKIIVCIIIELGARIRNKS